MNLLFEPIRLERQDEYLERLSRCPQVASDYSFINLWAWCEEYGLQWAWDQDFVWIRQRSPAPALWAPVGDWEAVDWRKRQNPLAAETVVIRVPERLSSLWQTAFGERIAVHTERGQWDYLYDFRDLVDLPGNRYHAKKNLLQQFLRSYAFQYTDFGPRTIEHAMAMQEDWCSWRDCESSELLAAENRAILRVLQQWEKLRRICGGALFVEGLIVAYTIAEPLTPETILIHFEKGCPAYKGAYQAIHQMFLAHAANGFRWVNREQDLDSEGLRKAKLSYHPADFVKKFRVVFQP